MENSHIGPIARTTNLTVKTLGSETVVYDHERHRVHCLNQSTSFIWQECDGRTQVEEIATRLPDMGLPANPDIVRSALKDLDRADLLVGETAFLTSDLPSRRTLVQRLGLAAASAAALLPAITSIVAPTPAMAGSGHSYPAMAGSGHTHK